MQVEDVDKTWLLELRPKLVFILRVLLRSIVRQLQPSVLVHAMDSSSLKGVPNGCEYFWS